MPTQENVTYSFQEAVPEGNPKPFNPFSLDILIGISNEFNLKVDAPTPCTEKFLSAVYPTTIGHLRSHSISLEVAEDLFQDVFIRFCKSIPSLNAQQSIKSYWWQAVSNAETDIHRRKASSVVPLSSLPMHLQTSETDNVIGIHPAREDFEEVELRVAIKELIDPAIFSDNELALYELLPLELTLLEMVSILQKKEPTLNKGSVKGRYYRLQQKLSAMKDF